MARQINITGKNQGRLIITPQGSDILVQREYDLIGDDSLLDEIPLRILERTFSFISLPENIKTALTEINAWTSLEIDREQQL